MKYDFEKIRALDTWLEERVKTVPSPTMDWSMERWNAYRAAVQDLREDMLAQGAGVRVTIHHTMVRCGGIASSSTSGLMGAISNWRTRAKAVLAQAQEVTDGT